MKKKRIVYRGFLAFLLTTPPVQVEFSPLESLKFAKDYGDVRLTKGKYTDLCRKDPSFLVRAKHSLIKDILVWAEPTGEE